MAGELIEIRGADGFLKLSKALKQAGETELRKGLHKGMRGAVSKHKPKAEARLDEVLPSGLKDRAKVRQAIRVKTGGNPGVSVVVPYGKRAAHGLGASNARMLNNQGAIRRPTFGREPWVTQPIDGGAGWFDEVWQVATPEVRRALEQEVQAVLEQIVRGAR